MTQLTTNDTIETPRRGTAADPDGATPRATLPQMTEQAVPEQSGLREYAQLLWRKKVTIIVVAGICVALSLAYSLLITPTYEATASVLLEPAISQTLIEANYPTGLSPVPDVPDGIQVLESSSVADLVRRSVPNAPSVTATEVGTTDVVQVSVRSTNAALAALAANAYAKAYITLEQTQTSDTFTAAEQQLQTKIDTVTLAISNVNAAIRGAAPGVNVTPDETQLGDLQSQLSSLQNQLQNYQFFATEGVSNQSGQVISQAVAPTKPVSPKTVEWAVLALIFGIILGIGVVLLANAISPRHD